MPDTKTWPDLAIGLYDKLTGQNAEITYAFETMQIEVPSKAGQDAETATWKLNGTVRVSTRNKQ